MNIFIFLIALLVFFYTLGYSITLWKEKNKMGSLAVLLLALSVIITPFFTVIR
ncbi:hypothetical protein ACFSO7_15480 [Bacillus sp. CGMCC 1.16607]|uniref:hypothetical protein n=1 Tax=Bacillus sp. CGMCC 1.16607 TaxID=3351842 RepID=UPI003637FB6D